MNNLSISVTATLVEYPLLTRLVEKMAVRRYEFDYCQENLPCGWEPIDISSIEAHVSGISQLLTERHRINMLFTTCLLFTCIKGNDDKYSLAWVNSLS